MIDSEGLESLQLFQSLPAATLTQLAQDLTEQQLAAGTVLFNQGDPGHNCFVILSGALEVLTFVDGKELRLDIFKRGQVIGEMALIDRSPRSATVRAVETSRLLVLTERDFITLIGNAPELAMSMLRSGSARMRNTNQRMIADLERKNAELLTAYEQLQAAQAELIRLNRIEEELAVARRIQESFLPRHLPDLPGWGIAGYSRGAQAVGGDFYDCIPLGDGRIGLIVADACGKGVTAALFVALTRSLLRAVSLSPQVFRNTHDNDAGQILIGAIWLTNDYLCREHADNNMFVTLFYGVLDPHSGSLAYANAGHNPPLVVSAAGTVRELQEGSLPIGVLEDVDYQVMHTSIAPGERLVAFSDGITEAMNHAGAIFGDERLQALLCNRVGQTADELLQDVLDHVQHHVAGAPQSDDMTLLVLARDPENGEAGML
jgi:sigma-B regulation protein RsbU (phosphoserine phosphatase)